MGEQGPQGTQGFQGLAGPKGQQGDDGISGDDVSFHLVTYYSSTNGRAQCNCLVNASLTETLV